MFHAVSYTYVEPLGGWQWDQSAYENGSDFRKSIEGWFGELSSDNAYSKGKYGDAAGFVDACLAKCGSGEADGSKGACGAVVVQYFSKEKKTPKRCFFKVLPEM